MKFGFQLNFKTELNLSSFSGRSKGIEQQQTTENQLLSRCIFIFPGICLGQWEKYSLLAHLCLMEDFLKNKYRMEISRNCVIIPCPAQGEFYASFCKPRLLTVMILLRGRSRVCIMQAMNDEILVCFHHVYMLDCYTHI